MKTVVMHLSAYVDSDAPMREHRAEILALYSSGYFSDAVKKIYEFNREPCVFLFDRFKNLDEMNKLRVKHILGLYGGTMEPSVQLIFDFTGHAEWQLHEVDIKKGLIEFGEKFKQQNVHLVDLHPPERGEKLLEDSVFQKRLYVVRQNMEERVFPNIQQIESIAEGVGIEHLTVDLVGGSLLIYSMGNDSTKFITQRNDLLGSLDSQGMIAECITDPDVLLTNYGNPDGYCQTHTYEEAREFLKTQFKVSSLSG